MRLADWDNIPVVREFWTILVIAAVLFASPGAGSDVQTPAGGEAGKPLNLILVVIDTLRADHLGCYGYPRATSPALDALATGGSLFTDASATSPWTKPSHASLLTGLYPSRHGAIAMDSSLSDSATHLATWLGSKGFQTMAVVNSRWLTMHGLERGFEEFVSVDYIQGRRPSSGVTSRAIRTLEKRDGRRPFFAMLHYMDVHSDYTSLPRYEKLFAGPYEGTINGSTKQLYGIAEGKLEIDEADVRHLTALYDAGIRQLDDELATLFRYLRRQGLLENSLLVITSDHGEELMDHGSVIHGHTQYQEVLHVPLILHGPGVTPGSRPAQPVSLIDIMPTALDLLGIETPAKLDGVSLGRLAKTADSTLAPRLLFAEADVTFPPPGPGSVPVGPWRAARDARFKLHVNLATGEVQMFDLVNDPGETRDIKAKHEEQGKGLYRSLSRHLAAGNAESPAETLTEEQLDDLRSLGYVGGE